MEEFIQEQRALYSSGKRSPALLDYDFSCPICTEVLTKVMTLPCGHSFCSFCLVSALSIKCLCPLCREQCPYPKHIKTNVLLDEIIRNNFPESYMERLGEIREENKFLKKVVVGNTHEIVRGQGDNKHRWRLYVRLFEDADGDGMGKKVSAAKYIENVTVNLHPSFNPSTVVLTQEPFELERMGWGLFLIRGKITWRSKFKKDPYEFQHMLQFDKDDVNNSFVLRFD